MKTALLIMAAGIGSRFGGGIKQLAPVGINDEIIMDYSIHDAIQAGFDKIIFVIRRDIEADFRQRVGDRVEAVCRRLGVAVAYCFQDLQNIPEGFSVPEGRSKPWGTGQAVLSAADVIREPFAVINADDYYGKEAFRRIHDYLAQPHSAFCMAGFILKNTLSENGGVTRGICRVENGMLTEILETRNIVSTPDGAAVNGVPVAPESWASMNMWGFPAALGEVPGYVKLLREGFREFFRSEVPGNPLKAEYLLPVHIGSLLEQHRAAVAVLPTGDKWFGITYREDRDQVVRNFRELLRRGVYEADLYSDL